MLYMLYGCTIKDCRKYVSFCSRWLYHVEIARQKTLKPCLATRVTSRIELILANSCQTTKNWRELASNGDVGIRPKPAWEPPYSRVANTKLTPCFIIPSLQVLNHLVINWFKSSCIIILHIIPRRWIVYGMHQTFVMILQIICQREQQKLKRKGERII